MFILFSIDDLFWDTYKGLISDVKMESFTALHRLIESAEDFCHSRFKRRQIRPYIAN